MAIDASIPLQLTPQPSPMATIGNLLNIQKTQAAIQGQNIANQGNQYTLDQRMALKNLVQGSRGQNPDGSINTDAVSKFAPVVAPELGGQVSQSDSQAATQNTASQAAQFGLNKDQWDEVSTNLGSLRSTVADKAKADSSYDPAADVLQRTTDLTKAGVISSKLAASFVSSLPDTSSMTAAQKAQTYDQWIVAHQQSALGASAQANLQAPQYTAIAGKKGTQLTNTNAYAPGVPSGATAGAPITPPGQLGTTPGGAPGVFNTGDNTVSGFTAPPTSAGNGGSLATAIPPGESTATGAQYQQQRQDTLATLRNAPNLLNLNQGIRDITSKGIALGTGGQKLQNLASAFGYQLSGDDATDRNMLTKKIAQATLASAASLPSNPSTNAGLQELQAANGSTSTDAKTLTAIADRSTALINGTQAYAAGLNAAMKNAQQANPNVDPIYAKPTFDQQWAANFDPDMTMYLAAKKRGDTAAMNSIIASHGGKNSQGAIDFATRMQAISRLQSTGSL